MRWFFCLSFFLFVGTAAAQQDGELLVWDADTQSAVGSGLFLEQDDGQGGWEPLDASDPGWVRRLNFGGTSFYLSLERDENGSRPPRPYIAYEGATALILERLKAISNSNMAFCGDGDGSGGAVPQTVDPWCMYIGSPAPGMLGWGVNSGLNEEANRLVTLRGGPDYAGGEQDGFSYVEEPVSTAQDEDKFPVGSFIAFHSSSNHNRNSNPTIRIDENDMAQYTTEGTGDPLDGHWRTRGEMSEGVYLAQRIE